MPDRVVLYLSPGSEDRQERAVARLCESLGLHITTRATNVDACVQLIVDDIADIVVAAADPRNGLRHRVSLAGGRILFARDRRQLPTLADWLRRAVGRGVTAHQLSEVFDEPTVEVSRIMQQMGIHPPVPKDDTNN